MSLRLHRLTGFRAFGVGFALLAVVGGSSLAAAQPTNAPVQRDFPSFRIIAERNIFNTTRSGRSTAAAAPRETRRAARTDSFTLVGTMDYAKGSVAFFDGSGSEYRKALRSEATIAGYQLVSILPDAVELAQGSNTVHLRIGAQMRREEGGEWRAADLTAATDSSQPDSEVADTTDGVTASEPSGDGGAGDGESEVLKRLMQQREKELK